MFWVQIEVFMLSTFAYEELISCQDLINSSLSCNYRLKEAARMVGGVLASGILSRTLKVCFLACLKEFQS